MQIQKVAYRPGLHIHSALPNVPPRAAILFFHGGGWVNGDPLRLFSPIWPDLLRDGIICASAEYRIRSRHKSTVYDSIDDAKAATAIFCEMQAVPVFLSGASAGGTLALLASLSAPVRGNIVFSAVFDLSASGYSNAATPKGGDGSISPLHLVGFPPTVVCHGTNDDTVPIASARDFARKPNVTLIEIAQAPHQFVGMAVYRQNVLDAIYGMLNTGLIEFTTCQDGDIALR